MSDIEDLQSAGLAHNYEPSPSQSDDLKQDSTDMNSALTYSFTRQSGTRPQDDADTCRICRTEAMPGELLFHPCKCSGSIRYVHQNCLMEWLSHSQKKYCELCKTPFRFTKLYHPQMPSRLPTIVFIRKALLHLLSWITFNARLCLVLFVWTVMLPGSVRIMWWFLLNFADARSAQDRIILRLAQHQDVHLRNGTISLSDAAALLNNATIGVATQTSPEASTPSNKLLNGYVYAGLKWLTNIHSESQPPSPTEGSSLIHQLVEKRFDSLYSNVTALNDLTSSNFLNRTVIDILEGLTITLGVVTGFVLIFLIREWVIQQQPLVNMQLDPVVIAQAGQEDVMEEAPVAPDDVDVVDRQPGELVEDQRHDREAGSASQHAAPPMLGGRGAEIGAGEEGPGQFPPRIDSVPHLDRQGRGLNFNNSSADDQQPLLLDTSSAEVGRRRNVEDGAENLGRIYESDRTWSTTTMRGSLPPLSTGSAVSSDEAQSIERTLSASPKLSGSSWESILDHQGDAQIDGESSTSGNSVGNYDAKISEGDRINGTVGHTHRDPYASSPNAATSITALDSTADTNDAEESDNDSDDGRVENTARRAVTMHPEAESENHLQAIVPEPTILGRLYNGFYGDLDQDLATQADGIGEDDEHIVQNIEGEPPFVPFADNQPAAPGNGPAENIEEQDENIDEDAAAGGPEIGFLDPDAADDIEDFEGILELVGVQGPITALFQNALFSGILIWVTMILTVGLPYICGKALLLAIAMPLTFWFHAPVIIFNAVEGFIADVSLLILGGTYAGLAWSASTTYRIAMGMAPFSSDPLPGLGTAAANVAFNAWDRLGNMTVMSHTGLRLAHLHASATAHESLDTLELFVIEVGAAIGRSLVAYAHALASSKPWTVLSLFIHELIDDACLVWNFLSRIDVSIPLLRHAAGPAEQGNEINLNLHHGNLDLLMTFWSIRDRVLTCLLSYAAFTAISCIYLSWQPPLFRSPRINIFERAMIEILSQAGGVCKVIMIISIEMMAFPLFCGFLLDAALLPLFDSATLASRIAFTLSKPFTSSFVHWFVGTCYMFHFALFVSMCRKIMRSGVLYFIRDPDDPNFHPVRDVLERSVWTQLKKIAFSAVVYGALIIICLGGVVWGLWAVTSNVLPIHWFHDKSTIEFPLLILFYNFVTPLILKNTKPSDGLRSLYKWWFGCCARFLHLSWFLFGKRDLREELLAPDVTSDSSNAQTAKLVSKGGRYVRAPSTDTVRIPRGEPTFVAVTMDNRRLDGKSETDGIHARDSSQTAMVYLPPWFKVRIGAFVLLIWLFAAVTGCGITVIPLLVGRASYRAVVPSARMQHVNDIYAFTIGTYVVGFLSYVGYKAFEGLQWAKKAHHESGAQNGSQALRDGALVVVRKLTQGVRLAYVYGTLAVGLPLALASLLQLYVLVPISTLQPIFETTGNSSALSTAPSNTLLTLVAQNHAVTMNKHTVHLVQDWTLGILYTRIGSRLMTMDHNSLLGRAASAVVASGGYFDPSARLATRYFVIPVTAAFALAIGAPYFLALLLNATVLRRGDEAVKMLVYRGAYPAIALVFLSLWSVRAMGAQVERWRGRIRDEVYLIGERLHNFGERGKGKARAVPVMVDVPDRRDAAL